MTGKRYSSATRRVGQQLRSVLVSQNKHLEIAIRQCPSAYVESDNANGVDGTNSLALAKAFGFSFPSRVLFHRFRGNRGRRSVPG